MTRPLKSSARPRIIVGETDAERLAGLALQHETANPLVAGMVLDELARAQIRPDTEVPDDVVRMDSTVRFRDEAHGREREVRLVYPSEADIAAGRISIMTPIGAGLIGLSAGQSILWPDRGGDKRVLRILSVARGVTSA